MEKAPMNPFNFDYQTLSISNDKWGIELIFERNSDPVYKPYDKLIDFNHGNFLGGNLYITIWQPEEKHKTCLIANIYGGIFLHTATEKSNCYSIKLEGNTLFASLGAILISFDIECFEVNWFIEPDISEIFELYDLEDDFLVRGEHAIHRIDKRGQVKWSYGGMDIWVNINGQEEVILEENQIRLTDFSNNKYVIDFDGNTLKTPENSL